MKLRNRNILEATADPAEKMLMRPNVGIKSADCPRRAHPSDQILILEKLKSAIDRGLRKTGKLFAQPAVDRFGGRMRQVFGQSTINRKPLRSNTYASCAALSLEFRAPAVDFGQSSGLDFVAANSHMRIIII